TFGGMFYQVYDEVADISLVESLHRILTLAAEQLKKMGAFCKKTMNAFFEVIIDTALKSVGLTPNNFTTS
ncbi:hypothetical protein LJC47_01360, partial [Desulfosarcina sp. OttesenSCG-928-B08]|nr:hypothetical protein [Desulfosarcina sp. OttesenSCG-928-B08]